MVFLHNINTLFLKLNIVLFFLYKQNEILLNGI